MQDRRVAEVMGSGRSVNLDLAEDRLQRHGNRPCLSATSSVR
jgi:hypothetical protein